MMDQVEEKEEEEATEARNKSRCLLALDLLTDCWTPPLPPLVSHSSLLSTLWSWPTSKTRGVPTRVNLTYLPRVLHVPQLCAWPEGTYHITLRLSFDLPSFACFYPLSMCRSNLVLMPPVLSLQPNKVYIGGLPEHTRKEDLESCFGKIGAILNVELKYVF